MGTVDLASTTFFESKDIPDTDIAYSGIIYSDSVENLVKIVRKRMDSSNVSLSFSSYVFSVFVELMTNISMHSDEKIEIDKAMKVSKGAFMLSFDGNDCRVYCKNLIKTRHIKPMEENLEYLNTLDKPSLRKFYKEKLKIRIDSREKRGAGLGLLEIARRASIPIEYSFIDYGEGISCFTVCVTLNKERVEDDEKNDESILFGDR